MKWKITWSGNSHLYLPQVKFPGCTCVTNFPSSHSGYAQTAMIGVWKFVASSQAGNHFSLQSHNKLVVFIRSSFSSDILEKVFSCTEVMLLLLRSSFFSLSSPTNAFFVMDLMWFEANPNLSNRFKPTNAPLISSTVVDILFKFNSLKSTIHFIIFFLYLHEVLIEWGLSTINFIQETQTWHFHYNTDAVYNCPR